MLLAGYACYTIVYLSIVHGNHAVTGHWPYNFMYKLDSSLKWLKFTLGQYVILGERPLVVAVHCHPLCFRWLTVPKTVPSGLHAAGSRLLAPLGTTMTSV